MRIPQRRYSDTTRNLAPILAQHKDGREILRAIVQYEKQNGGDCEFDVAEAVYWIGALYHGGQGCPLYAAMCATHFEPGRCQRGPDISANYLYEEIVRILS